MEDTIDHPLSATRTEVAVAAAGAIDLKKIDLTAVALAQFGDWRAATAKLKADNTKTVLDLSTQTKIDDAISLRQRTVKQPLAEARKVDKFLKSKLAETSKAVGAELVLIEAAYADASIPMTTQIDAAQAKIDAAKEAIRQAEIARLAALREAVTEALAAWAERCREEGITAERIGRGVAMLEQLEPDPAWAEVDAYWQSAKAQTLATMRGLQAAAQQREDAARIEAQRLENERIAAENARIAAEAAAESARVAAAAAAEKAAAEALMEQARQMLAAAEAKRLADQETDRAADAARAQAAAEAATIKPNAQSEEGALKPADVPATQEADAPLGMCASSEAQAAQASPSGDEDPARADHSVPVSAFPFGGFDPKFCPGSNPDNPQTEEDLNTTSEAAPQQASDPVNPEADAAPGGTEGRGMATTDTLYWRNPAPHAAQPLHGLPTIAMQVSSGAPAISDTMRDRVMDLQALMKEPRESKFPHAPKGLEASWWAALYAAVDSLAAEVA